MRKSFGDKQVLNGIDLTVQEGQFLAIIGKNGCGKREWIVAVGAKTAFIAPGSPWENGYCESLNSKLCDELLNGEIFYSLAEAMVIIEAWRRYYNTERPHSSL